MANRFYMGVGIAIRERRSGTINDVDVEPLPLWYVGASKHEAEGWGMEELQARYPSKDGYLYHKVGMHEMPIEKLESIFQRVKTDA